MKKEWDVIIIGGGVAGLSAAMYASRFMLKTLVITKERLGLLATTHVVENYPSYKKINGRELVERIEEHAKSNGAEILEEEVTRIKRGGGDFRVFTEEGSRFTAKAIIIATGTKRRELEVPGAEEFYGKGVSYCASCDAPLFKNGVVGVVGGSDSAAKESLMLADYAKKVFIIYRRDRIRAEPINRKRVDESPKIEVINNANVTRINGDKTVKSVTLDREYEGGKELELDGLFIEIGSIPLSDLVKPLGVKVDERGEIVTDKESKTSVEGVFAAGDCCDHDWKQAIISASQGSYAAFSAYEFVKKNT